MRASKAVALDGETASGENGSSTSAEQNEAEERGSRGGSLPRHLDKAEKELHHARADFRDLRAEYFQSHKRVSGILNAKTNGAVRRILEETVTEKEDRAFLKSLGYIGREKES